MMPDFYSTEQFEAEYTYTGSDLGASWTREKTVFRLWAPTAIGVKVNLYKTGTPGAKDLLEQIELKSDVNGTWLGEKQGNLSGVYYTYEVAVNEQVVEACDPYARTTGVNGQRAMVLDLRSTDPRDWDLDRDPHAGNRITDAVIYELHVRDLSADAGSGIAHKGKFLGVIEQGTHNSGGVPTGLDHIRAMGVTHVQLLPVYDYGSVDEALDNSGQYNWGYDPQNYNVPEGSYATDPYHGEVRVREMKQMIKGLHDAGLSVVMDVVYNHVYKRDQFCFNRIVPNYFSRYDRWGNFSDGSGCGNDTASERSMVKKYIVDSVNYWADEYHIDGFRFDLAGILDTETINAVIESVHQRHPNVLFYGEGWSMNTNVTKPGYAMTVQNNATLVQDFGFFNDTFRDLLRGSVFDNHVPGYICGAYGNDDLLRRCVLARVDWCKMPGQTVNYASCHDNMALYDRITMAAPHQSPAIRARMNRLAAAIVMLSQGVPFLQAGEEMLRSKPRAEGGFEENSYRSPDSVNSLKWETLNEPEYRDTVAYYQGLIAFRKAHPVLRLDNPEDVRDNVAAISGLEPNTAAFHFRNGAAGETAQGMYVVFNATPEFKKVPLPPGKWNVNINHQQAGTETLATVQNKVNVPAFSAMVLVREPVYSVKKRFFSRKKQK